MDLCSLELCLQYGWKIPDDTLAYVDNIKVIEMLLKYGAKTDHPKFLASLKTYVPSPVAQFYLEYGMDETLFTDSERLLFGQFKLYIWLMGYKYPESSVYRFIEHPLSETRLLGCIRDFLYVHPNQPASMYSGDVDY